MRNTLILTEQIKENRAVGLDDYHAVIEATVQRTRPVILTALAAVLAFIPLTHSVFWGSMAYTLIGGTAVGTVLILLFLPALYAAWFRIKSPGEEAFSRRHVQSHPKNVRRVGGSSVGYSGAFYLPDCKNVVKHLRLRTQTDAPQGATGTRGAAK
jgi:predicted RND superfamily exporter protein